MHLHYRIPAPQADREAVASVVDMSVHAHCSALGIVKHTVHIGDTLDTASWYHHFPAIEHMARGLWSPATQCKDMPGMPSPLSAAPVRAEAIRAVRTAMAPGASSDEEAVANAAAHNSNRMKRRCTGCTLPIRVWGNPSLHPICSDGHPRFHAR